MTKNVHKTLNRTGKRKVKTTPKQVEERTQGCEQVYSDRRKEKGVVKSSKFIGPRILCKYYSKMRGSRSVQNSQQRSQNVDETGRGSTVSGLWVNIKRIELSKKFTKRSSGCGKLKDLRNTKRKKRKKKRFNLERENQLLGSGDPYLLMLCLNSLKVGTLGIKINQSLVSRGGIQREISQLSK